MIVVFGTKLARLDSNQERQDQNLVCYHYTTGQRRYGSAITGQAAGDPRAPDNTYARTATWLGRQPATKYKQASF